MPGLILVCTFFLICAILFSNLTYRTIATPMVCFFAMYLVVALTFVALSRVGLGVFQMDNLSGATLALLYSTFATFLLGSVFACLFKPKRSATIYWSRRRYLRLLHWARLLSALGMSGALGIEAIVVRNFGNPLTSTEAARYAMSAGTFAINPLLWLAFYANVFAVADWTVLGVLFEPRFLKAALGTLAVGLLIAHSLGQGGISVILAGVFGATYVMANMYVGEKSVIAHKLFIGATLLLVLLTANAYFRSANERESVEGTIVLHDGVYISGVLPALQAAITNPPVALYPGFWTFPAVYHYVNMFTETLWHQGIYSVEDINHRFHVDLFAGLPGFFNSCPEIGWWYAEGGFAFAAALSLVLGWYTGWIFTAAIRTGKPIFFELGAISWAYLIMTYRGGFILDDPWVFTWVVALLGRRWLLAW